MKPDKSGDTMKLGKGTRSGCNELRNKIHPEFLLVIFNTNAAFRIDMINLLTRPTPAAYSISRVE